MFDKMVAHLREQKAFSAQSPNSMACSYRGAGGTKCAIGALIPDDKYDPDFEGHAVRLGMFDFEETDLRFLQDAQKSLHDDMRGLNRAWNPIEFEARVLKFSYKYDLEYN
jgi:hypothetical protein